MSISFESPIPSDICLLLRADAEQCWLSREVIPVLEHLETRELLPEEEVCAALAYLEAMWDEAISRARETDAAHALLDAHTREQSATLWGPAGRYHAAVRVLRGTVAERVTPLVEPSQELDAFDDAGGRGTHTESCSLRIKDARASERRPSTGGYTPRAA
jgi:hypothetical protein